MKNKYVPMRILGPNECPNCGCRTLNLIDIDISVRKINDIGQLSESKDGCKLYIRCAKCGKHYNAIQRGNYARIDNHIYNPHLLDNPFYKE